MPRGETTPGLSSGDHEEVRAAQVWFWDGYYVRRGIDLQQRFGKEALLVTDLDLLGYSFSQALVSRKYIGEIKSGRSNNTPRPLDRALWARGLRELVSADGAEVTTAFNVAVSMRDFARTFGVSVQTFDDLTTREARLLIHEVEDIGSQGLTVAALIEKVRKNVKSEPDLERAFWFLRSEVWFLNPFDALKRNLGLLRQLKSRWSDQLDEDSLTSLRWLYAESISIFGLHIALISEVAQSMDEDSFKKLAAGKLAAGDIAISSMENLSDRIDKYISAILRQTNASMELRTEALGAFYPIQPEYTEPLLELVRRLVALGPATARLPRQLDFIVFERLVRQRSVGREALGRLGFGPAGDRVVKLVAAFLRGQAEFPDTLDAVMADLLGRSTKESQQSLFDDAANGSGSSTSQEKG